MLDDHDNVHKTTEVISIKSHRISLAFFEYLRSTLTSHYEEIGGKDHEYLMISCPRVINFE